MINTALHLCVFFALRPEWFCPFPICKGSHWVPGVKHKAPSLLKDKQRCPLCATNPPLPLHLSSSLTKPDGKLCEEKAPGAMQAGRVAAWQLSEQGKFPAESEKQTKKSQGVIRNKANCGIWRWPSGTCKAEQCSSQSNKLQFCTPLCEEIETCPQNTA